MQIVGSLLFLSTRSRPDLSFAVNYLSLYMTKGNQHHLDLCYKVPQYLWQSRYLTLTFNGTKGINFFDKMAKNLKSRYTDNFVGGGMALSLTQRPQK